MRSTALFVKKILVFLSFLSIVGNVKAQNECDGTWATATFIQGLYPQEVSYVLTYLGDTSFSYWGVANNTVQNLCLPDGCYSLELYDTFGDGWNGAIITFAANGLVLASATMDTGSYLYLTIGFNAECDGSILYGCTYPDAINYDPEALANDGSCIYEGCTDGAALNYDPTATLDDGSCEYCNGEGSVTASLYVCTFSYGNQVELQILDSQGNEVIYVSGLSNGNVVYFDVCLQEGECYTANMINNAGPFGWYGGYFWVSLNGLQIVNDQPLGNVDFDSTIFSVDGNCGGIVYGCTDPAALNYNPEATTSDYTCMYPWPGCIDPQAINYDPNATVDNGTCIYPEECDQNLLTFILNPDFWPYEMSYFVFDENGFQVAYGNGANAYACVPDGCYTLAMYDSFGDGWSSGSLDVLVNGIPSYNFTLAYGNYDSTTFGINVEGCTPVYTGCTDPNAINYNSEATEDDGSCNYCYSSNSTLYVCTFSNANEVELAITDDEGNEVIYVSNLYGNGIAYFELCLDSGMCYTATMINNSGPFGWYGGYFWISNNGAYIINNQLNYGEQSVSVEFSIDGTCGPISGCTDPNALNYNPEATFNDNSCVYPYYGCTDTLALNYDPYATVDNGSCFYPEACEQNLLTFVLNSDPWPYEMSYFIYDENGAQVAWGNGSNTYACVPDGCYSLAMYDSFGDGWTTGSLDVFVNGVLTFNFTLAVGNYELTSFGVNTEGCVPVNAGCTDPLALNYNSFATEDDGSCIYGEECESNLVEITINTQAWGSEISWYLIAEDGTVAASGNEYESWNSYSNYYCLETGCYQMVMEDSWGDGWNGGYYTISGYGTYNEGSLYYGETATDMVGINTWCNDSIPGCTDSLALNYNPWASFDDGSCMYNDNEGFSPEDLFGLELEFTLYPNPSNSEIILNVNGLSALSNIQIDIIGLTGQKIESFTVGNSETFRVLELNVNQYAAGFYLLNLTNGDRIQQMSFIKQ